MSSDFWSVQGDSRSRPDAGENDQAGDEPPEPPRWPGDPVQDQPPHTTQHRQESHHCGHDAGPPHDAALLHRAARPNRRRDVVQSNPVLRYQLHQYSGQHQRRRARNPARSPRVRSGACRRHLQRPLTCHALIVLSADVGDSAITHLATDAHMVASASVGGIEQSKRCPFHEGRVSRPSTTR